ncbi:MAG: phosphoribosylformylglycinamidine cyclo-ligase, partial [Dehalococcoidia bacterium]|nr:phosphoribosylformylglycinamidine cyclo-ligase [Dehalococcoidia bacterium]
AADAAKAEMARALIPTDDRVLNRLGAFASLFAARFPDVADPVLVMKTEEPGSKQKLAFQHGRYESICYDLINHLINDIAVMGAVPLIVQDAIICGKLDPAVVSALVTYLAQACRAQGCTLVGGETSEQPGVIPAGTYILTASVVGVVDRAAIIDGSRIAAGDTLLAVASNGLHTNGYSLVRALIDRAPDLLTRPVGAGTFLDAILLPHLCYLPGLRGLFGLPGLHGLAHITGGGVRDNLGRILPRSLTARVDLGAFVIPPVFRVIREAAAASDAEMLRTYNLGVGLIAVVAPDAVATAQTHLAAHAYTAYPIGHVAPGEGGVQFEGALRWNNPATT